MRVVLDERSVPSSTAHPPPAVRLPPRVLTRPLPYLTLTSLTVPQEARESSGPTLSGKKNDRWHKT